ncbi:hypothetical protein [Rhodovastum atsumiense]|uniref:Uncharacterized protein n=1 Tax=Rhodovastum atsumiense TaxID=504468 RepID=A0A5M6IUQ3_9PROT|nr:hypothetical protein [Rhodovastum atsumiense]KAA5611597.1 hypothetical protein F1189_13620 [Rhodovastum atsumiense]
MSEISTIRIIATRCLRCDADTGTSADAPAYCESCIQAMQEEADEMENSPARPAEKPHYE